MARRGGRGRDQWTVHAAPHIAESVVSYCRTMLDRVEYMHFDPAIDVEEAFSRERIASEYLVVEAAFDSGDLHWVSRDLCEVVGQTYESVPEWTPSQVLPSEHGVVFMETAPAAPVRFVDLPSGTASPLNAFCWTSVEGRILISILTRGSAIHAAAKDVDLDMLPSPLYTVYSLNLDPDLAQGAGRVDPTMLTGTDTIAPAFYTDEEEMRDVLALIGTTWLLMGQSGVTRSTETTPPPTSRARKAAARGEAVPEVVVTEHALSRKMAYSQRAGTGSGRKATSRWWVRGHWRQQACGPGRTQRRPVYIEPHTAGAAGAEVDSRPRVHRHRA